MIAMVMFHALEFHKYAILSFYQREIANRYFASMRIRKDRCNTTEYGTLYYDLEAQLFYPDRPHATHAHLNAQ
jgi:hypothetical protein